MRPQGISRIRAAVLLTLGGVAIVAACTMDAPSAPVMSAGSMMYDSVSQRYATGRSLDSLTESKVEPAMNVILETGNYEKANGILVERDPADTTRSALRRVKHQGVDAVGELIVEQGTVSGRALIEERVPAESPAVLNEAQVEREARPIPETMTPEFPAGLKAANVSGEVLMSVVISENGKPDMSTFRVVRSSHPLFTEAVRAAVRRSVWTPASVGGRSVRQRAMLPFAFSIK